MAGMTPEEHKSRHEFLHRALDELVADYFLITGRLFSSSSIMDLMKWSNEQTINPVDVREVNDAHRRAATLHHVKEG